MKVKIKLEPGGITPSKATAGAAAYDVYAPADFKVKAGRSVMPLNFCIELPKGYEAMIEPRSGFSSKGIRGKVGSAHFNYDADVLPGKIDSDYRGVVGVIINNRDEWFIIPKGLRIAQMTLRKVAEADFIEVEQLSETKRGAGGFGSTKEY